MFAKILSELSEIYDLLGDQHRAAAYERASYIDDFGADNVGKSVANKWIEYQTTGKVTELDKLKTLPKVVGLRSLMGVLGVGPRLASQWMNTGIKNIDDLQNAVAKGDVQLTAVQTLGLRHYADLNRRVTRKQAETIYKKVVSLIGTLSSRVELVGSYRRGLDTVGDVDILVECDGDKSQEIISNLEEFPLTGWVMKGKHRLTFLAKCADLSKADQVIQCDLLIVPRAEWTAALLYFTGSKLFNERLRSVAKKRGWLLNQRGLFDEKNVAFPVTCEKDIFDKLQVTYLRPEERI